MSDFRDHLTFKKKSIFFSKLSTDGSGKSVLFVNLEGAGETLTRVSAVSMESMDGEFPLVRSARSLVALNVDDILSDDALKTSLVASLVIASGLSDVSKIEKSQDTGDKLWADLMSSTESRVQSGLSNFEEDEGIQLDNESLSSGLRRSFLADTAHQDLRTGRGFIDGLSFRSVSVKRGFDLIKALSPAASDIQALSDMIKDVEKYDADGAFRALRACGNHGREAFMWYGARPGQGLTEEALRDRHQAADAFPILAERIATNKDMRFAVENRESLQPLFMQKTGLSKGSLKRLSKVDSQLLTDPAFSSRRDVHGENAIGVDGDRQFFIPGRGSLDEAFSALKDMPPDWTPSTNQEWKDFSDILFSAAIPWKSLIGAPISETLKSSKGRWGDFKATLAKSADIPVDEFDRRRIALAMTDAAQGLMDFASQVVIPLSLKSVSSRGFDCGNPSEKHVKNALDASIEVISGGAKNPLSSVLEFSRRHITRIPALLNASGLQDANAGASVREGPWGSFMTGSWPPLLQVRSWEASNGLILTCLNNIDLLVHESAQLSHCVGDYYLEKSEKGDCHIISVQRKDGKSRSTVEIKPPSLWGGPVPKVVQHKAKNNARPNEEDLLAVREFISHISENPHLLSSGLEPWRQMMKDVRLSGNGPSRATWDSVTGQKDAALGVKEAAWSEWGGNILRMKSAPPEALFKFAKMRNMIYEVNPEAGRAMAAEASEKKKNASRDEEMSP